MRNQPKSPNSFKLAVIDELVDDFLCRFGFFVWKLLDKLRLPSKVNSTTTREEVATFIEAFIDGSCGKYDFDDFTSGTYSDPLIQAVMTEVASIDYFYPSTKRGNFCSDAGFDRLRELAKLLRS